MGLDDFGGAGVCDGDCCGEFGEVLLEAVCGFEHEGPVLADLGGAGAWEESESRPAVVLIELLGGGWVDGWWGVEDGVADEMCVDLVFGEPLGVEGEEAEDAVGPFLEAADTPGGPCPDLWSDEVDDLWGCVGCW